MASSPTPAGSGLATSSAFLSCSEFASICSRSASCSARRPSISLLHLLLLGLAEAEDAGHALATPHARPRAFRPLGRGRLRTRRPSEGQRESRSQDRQVHLPHRRSPPRPVRPDTRPPHSTRCVARRRESSWRRNLAVRDVNGLCENVGRPHARCYTRVVGWKARDRGLWLTLAALTVLLVVLAALQYKWTSEIGRAEAERRQTQLERSTWRFANAFDREMGQVLTAFFRMEPPPPAEGWRALLLERLAAWRTTEHAALLSQVLLATRTPSGEVRLEACAAGDTAFHQAEWTPELEPLRQRLQATEGGRDGFFIRPGFLFDRPLALSFPLVDDARRQPARPAMGTLPASRASSFFSSTSITCASTSCPSSRRRTSGRWRRASSSWPWCGGPTVPSSTRATRRPGWAPPSRATCSAASPGAAGGPGGDRPGAGPGPGFGERPPDDARDREARRPSEEESPWLLVARHRGGSLEESVARVRRRNLGGRLRRPRRCSAPPPSSWPPGRRGPGASRGSRWSSWPASRTSSTPRSRRSAPPARTWPTASSPTPRRCAATAA